MKADPKIVFGKAVRQRRSEQGWSQEALAEKAGLHWTYVGSVERGERNISLVNMAALARALGVPLRTLVQEIK
jgi:transcriptional regulator with XRE-family HTH domain